MTAIQAFLIAILQGASELFPVSSLGHAVVVPALLHWPLDQKAPAFLPFLVLLHTGTAAALLAFFWRDWWALACGVVGRGDDATVNAMRRRFVLIVIATIPAVILGATLEKFVRGLFASPILAAAMLVLNGMLLLFGERLRKTGGARDMDSLNGWDALAIGCWQCTALVPGISRAGATMVGGLLRGLNHGASAHFSFLIATPIIIGATVLETRHLFGAAVPPGTFQLAALAAVVAGIVAWLSTWFLMRYFRHHDDWALNPFAYYCIAFGLAASVWLGLA